MWISSPVMAGPLSSPKFKDCPTEKIVVLLASESVFSVGKKLRDIASAIMFFFGCGVAVNSEFARKGRGVSAACNVF